MYYLLNSYTVRTYLLNSYTVTC